jgi:hypothetical protein
MPVDKGKNKPLTTIVPIDIAERFEKIAEENDRTVSREILILIKKAVNDHDKSANK